jgi:hypothetical protein
MSILRKRVNSFEVGFPTYVNYAQIAATLRPVVAERMSDDDSDSRTSMEWQVVSVQAA